jgi:hypothetical protein
MMNPYQSPLPELVETQDDLPTAKATEFEPRSQNQIVIKLAILIMFGTALAIGVLPFTWFLWVLF